MTNKLTFSINTEAPYSQDEIDELLGAFVDWIADADSDVDKSSAEIDVKDSMLAEGVKEDPKIREAAAGLIANGIVEVSVRILDLEENVISKKTFSTDD